MEFSEIDGKRINTKLYHIAEKDAVYMLKEKKSSSLYLQCYFDQCLAKGVIKNEKFYDNESCFIHNNHKWSTKSLLTYLSFFKNLRMECTKATKPLCLIFNDTYGR